MTEHLLAYNQTIKPKITISPKKLQVHLCTITIIDNNPFIYLQYHYDKPFMYLIFTPEIGCMVKFGLMVFCLFGSMVIFGPIIFNLFDPLDWVYGPSSLFLCFILAMMQSIVCGIVFFVVFTMLAAATKKTRQKTVKNYVELRSN